MSEKQENNKETCEAKGGTWNEETKECTMPESTEKAENDITLGLTPRFTKVMQETMVMFKAQMEQEFNRMMKEQIATLSIEAEQVLRKGLGLAKASPLTTDDMPKLIEAVRKASLEKTEKERGPAATEKAGPEGNKEPEPIDKLFDQYLKEEKKQ